MGSGRLDCGAATGVDGVTETGRADLARGSTESGLSTSGGCEEYRVGLSIPGDVGGSNSGSGAACVGNALGTGVGCAAGGTGAGGAEGGIGGEDGAAAAAVVPEAVRIRSSASAA
jgi:hypothetical protein